MSKKTVFVILWLTFSSFLLAQAPADGRTMPASDTKTQPCWEQVMKTMADGVVCLSDFSEELRVQKNNPKALEELELAGVRFLKANGYPEEDAVAVIAKKIKQLSSAPVAETSERTKPVTTKEVKPAPAVSEETPKEEEIHELRKQVADLQKLGARDKMISLRAAQIDLENKIKKEQKRLQKIKDEDSSARKARKEIEKREDAERKTRERFALAWSNAKPKCRGSQDPAGIRILSTGHFNYNPFQAFNVVLVTNWQPFPIIITAVDPNKGGEVVELPYGCSVTLGRSIIPGRENVNNGGVTFYYTATASNLNNHQREFRSQSFYLRSGNSSMQQDSSRWHIGQQPVEYSSSY